jgi:hypothetical protein
VGEQLHPRTFETVYWQFSKDPRINLGMDAALLDEIAWTRAVYSGQGIARIAF